MKVKTIPTHSDHLILKFNETIAAIYALEKKLIKPYQKLKDFAHTHELTKCLSPISTDSEQHLKRLELIRLSIGKKNSIKANAVALPVIKLKKASTEQDLDIIEYALNFQSCKLGYYEFLHPMAMALTLEIEAELIEQTITDNRNTNTWLRQIVKNIVIPKLLSAPTS